MQDWTLICAWLTMIFAIVYFIFGDFVSDNYEIIDKKNGLEKKDDSVRLEFAATSCSSGDLRTKCCPKFKVPLARGLGLLKNS